MLKRLSPNEVCFDDGRVIGPEAFAIHGPPDRTLSRDEKLALRWAERWRFDAPPCSVVVCTQKHRYVLLRGARDRDAACKTARTELDSKLTGSNRFRVMVAVMNFQPSPSGIAGLFQAGVNVFYVSVPFSERSHPGEFSSITNYLFGVHLCRGQGTNGPEEERRTGVLIHPR